ncbi:MAG: aspartate aminotransferase family protein [Desulfuromonadales bacterium]|jgi:ornithine--oxo-acid transaminase
MPQKSSHDLDHEAACRMYADRVNKQWVKFLDLLGMNVPYSRCVGTKLHTATGDCYTDFLSGYCVQNLGHNHAAVADALRDALDRQGPLILQSLVPHHAARLAERLTTLAGGRMDRVTFTNTGSEGVETAMKFARVHTGRPGILACLGAFHGASYGAMSIMRDDSWCGGCGPFLPETACIPYLDLAQLEEHLKTGRYAAFIVEGLQSEAGLRLLPKEHFLEAQKLCRQYGTLLVLDEVQTGVFRTGEFLISHHFGIEPDMVILSKALSGGMMPVGAVLMSAAINESVFSGIDKAFFNQTTFSENGLSMRAALATLDVIEQEDLAERATFLGRQLREKVTALVPKYEMLKEIRGIGLMNGVELQPPQSLKLKALYKSCSMAHPALFGQMVVMKMFRKGKILTQICGNSYLTIKASPPLVASEADLDQFVDALEDVMADFQSGRGFTEGLQIARRAFGR